MYESNDAVETHRRKPGSCASALPDAGWLAAEAATSFAAKADQGAVDPVVVRFRAVLKSVQANELERLYKRLPELDEHSRLAIWEFADCLVAKMLHPPLECLRIESRRGPPRRLLDALQQLFRLGE